MVVIDPRLNKTRKKRANTLSKRLCRKGAISKEQRESLLEMIHSTDEENLSFAEGLMKGAARDYNRKFKWKT